MKKIGLAALTVALMCGSAYAADLRGGLKDDADAGPAIAKTAFVGFGFGIQGGGQFDNIDINDQFDGIGADGLVGGVHGEYLLALGNLRVGPYLEGGFSNVNTAIGSYDNALSQDYYFGGGVKGGAVVGSSLIFLRAGYERAIWSTDFDSSVDINVDSLVLGAGIDSMITSNLSVGLGVDYLVPMNIEVDSHDLTDLLKESEGLRVMGRLTFRR